MFKTRLFSLVFLLATVAAMAQTESGQKSIAQKSWLEGGAQSPQESMQTSPPLAHPKLQEADILWEKRIWRVIDTREKMNLAFRHPELGLFSVVQQGIEAGSLQAYDPIDDRFSTPIPIDEVMAKLSHTDTVNVYNIETNTYEPQIVHNDFDPNSIKRWRVQEVWFFDSRHGSMKSRIIGIAPLLEKTSELTDEVLYESPLFWINYEEARPLLAQNAVAQWGNDKVVNSWEDLFAMRRFASYVYQENDMHGRRIHDYAQGKEALLVGQKIEQTIHNYEHDLWSN